MRSLYWKIFISFWFTTILIIVSTALVTSELARKSSVPAHEKIFMDSNTTAAITTLESNSKKTTLTWLKHAGTMHHMQFFLICDTGEIISGTTPPHDIKKIAQNFVDDTLDEGLIKFGNIIVSHEVLSMSGHAYRLAAITAKPIYFLTQISWTSLTIRLIIAIFFSGLICYFLSRNLTKPLRSLSLAAKSIATGHLDTRVGSFRGHYRDEIAELSSEFDTMAEKLEQLVCSKERLLQDISHELRSPLARLQIALEIGRKKTNNTAEVEFSRMEEECIRLNALIGEILEYSRLNKATYILNKTLVNIPTLIKQIVKDANYEFGQDKNRIRLSTIDQCKLSIDARLFHRAVENVLRNALRYSPDNELVTISITQDTHAHTLEIAIEDNGPGIPEEQLDKIFNPFYRVDKSRTKKTGGYGLGLAIAEQAIRQHHGSITIQNRHPKGLKVCIILPFPEDNKNVDVS